MIGNPPAWAGSNSGSSVLVNSAKPIIRQFRIIGLALGVGLWGALVLLFAAPLSLTGRISWRETVSFGVSFWALWLFFLPAVG